jgi:uncharacterized protein (TIGR02996 family)
MAILADGGVRRPGGGLPGPPVVADVVAVGQGLRRLRLRSASHPTGVGRTAHLGRRLDESAALAPLTPAACFAASGRSAKFTFFRLTFHNAPVLSTLVFRPLLCSGPAVGLLAGRAAGFFRAPRPCREPAMTEDDFHEALRADPHDLVLRLVFADWLEERGDPRGELLRLTHLLTRPDDPPDRTALEERVRRLVADGVGPVGPFVTNAVGLRFAWVPPGTFRMGSPDDEPLRDGDEELHTVTLTRGFFLAVHPVTQAQWRTLMGTNPSATPGDDHPVETVNWDECRTFLERLNWRRQSYRLPTEAEWEYACRAGTTSPYFFGHTITFALGNYDGDAGTVGRRFARTAPVGSYPPNAWGLHDMHGNVYDWCADSFDTYAATPDRTRPLIDPVGSGGTQRSFRGGGWRSRPHWCRSAYRNRNAADFRSDWLGCRPVLVQERAMERG